MLIDQGDGVLDVLECALVVAAARDAQDNEVDITALTGPLVDALVAGEVGGRLPLREGPAVHQVLRTGDGAQIGPAVIECVAVDVVHLHRLGVTPGHQEMGEPGGVEDILNDGTVDIKWRAQLKEQVRKYKGHGE